MKATLTALIICLLTITWYATSIHYEAKLYHQDKLFRIEALHCDSINKVNIIQHQQDSILLQHRRK